MLYKKHYEKEYAMVSITTLVNYLMTLVGKLGYLGILTIVGLEYACFPIPSEVVLPFVDMSIAQTSLSFLPAYLTSMIAGLLGSYICYLIGYWGGHTLLDRLSNRSAQVKTATSTFNHWFSRYGRFAVLFARVIPLTRTYISLFAGVNGMSLFEFTLYSVTGIALWNLLLMSLGFYLGNNWSAIEGILNTYSNIVLSLLAMLMIYLAFKKIKAYKD